MVSIAFLCMLFGHVWRRNKSKLFGAMMMSTVATLVNVSGEQTSIPSLLRKAQECT
jgi:hypothetical protein